MATRSAAPAAGAGPEATADPNRWWVLAVVCCAYLMVGLDLTVMSLALPEAQLDLGFSDGDRQWIVTAYALPYGSLLLFCGRLSDLMGRKRAFLIGLTGFAVASAVGGAAPNFETLVAARASQGAFAALLSPACLALLTVTFTDPKERGKAFGAIGGVIAAGGGLGLLLGGLLTSAFNWRWCMYVNLIFAVVALVGALTLIARQDRSRNPLDIPGVLLACSGMFCVVYGFAEAEDGWGEPGTWGLLVLGGLLLIVFAAWQTRAAYPLLPPRVVLDRNRGGCYLTVLFVGAGFFGLLLFLIYYMQTVLGYSPLKSGVAMLPMVVATLVTTVICGAKLFPRLGPRPMVPSGLLITALGLVWLTQIQADSTYTTSLLGPIIANGVGMGLVYAAALNTGTAGVRAEDSGIASASFNAGQQIGGAVGTALLNTIATTAVADWLTDNVDGRPSPVQLQAAAVHSYTTVFWWSAAILGGATVIAAALLRSGPLPAPEQSAEDPAAPSEAQPA